jgi:hypothetical protein
VSEVIAYAEALAGLLNTELDDRDNKARATTNLRNLTLPGILVSPVVRRDQFTLPGGYLATWSIYCIAPGPGDLTDAKLLDELADVVVEVVDAVYLVEPVTYVLPSAADAKPALRCEFSTDVTP